MLYVPLLREGHADRHDQRHARAKPAVSAITIAAAADLRRPGRDRHRERAAVQRDPGGAGAADRDGRNPQGDRQLAVRRAAGVRSHRRDGEPACRSRLRRVSLRYEGDDCTRVCRSDESVPTASCGLSCRRPGPPRPETSIGRLMRGESFSPHHRRLGRSRLPARRSVRRHWRMRLPHLPCRAAAARGRSRYRRDQRLSPRSPAFHRQADRTCCRPSPTRP